MLEPYLLPQEVERDILDLASKSKLLLFGEWHGTQEVPRLIAGLLPGLRSLGYQGLALEAPCDIRDALAEWMVGTEPQASPPAFFSSPWPDGRGNEQVLSLLRQASDSRQDWTVLCFDQGIDQPGLRWADRDYWMAKNLLAQWQLHCPQAKVVGICGNLHSRLMPPGEEFGLPEGEELWPSFADRVRQLEPEIRVGAIDVIPRSGALYHTGIQQIQPRMGPPVDTPETRPSEDGGHSLELHLPEVTPATFLAEPKVLDSPPHQGMMQPTIANLTPFLLAHLHPGLAVLDCGCGDGSLTLDLAERVAPGEVIGVDAAPSKALRVEGAAPDQATGVDFAAQLLDQARHLATARRLANVRFEQASVYELPFADASFDVVYSNSLLSGLEEPERALAEMRRVLRPQGIVAVIDHDPATWVVSPAESAASLITDLFARVPSQKGGNRLLARDFRAALIEAGFARVEMYAVGEGYGTAEQTRFLASMFAAIAASPDFRQTVLSEGWATPADLDALPSALAAWGERRDAFGAVLKCGALGWATDAT